MKASTTNRRSLLALLSGAFALKPGRLLAAIRTPSTAEGPFYPDDSMRFADADNDLVKIEGVVREAGGEVVILNGRVLKRNGMPVANARVEIWQCDVNGRYLHSGDNQTVERDGAFQGFGHVVTGADGTYEFRTIKPVSYPGRTPHIHVKIIAGSEELTTQLYIAGEAANERDFLYLGMNKAQREAVEMVFGDKGRGLEARVDLII